MVQGPNSDTGSMENKGLSIAYSARTNFRAAGTETSNDRSVSTKNEQSERVESRKETEGSYSDVKG